MKDTLYETIERFPRCHSCGSRLWPKPFVSDLDSPFVRAMLKIFRRDEVKRVPGYNPKMPLDTANPK